MDFRIVVFSEILRAEYKRAAIHTEPESVNENVKMWKITKKQKQKQQQQKKRQAKKTNSSERQK